MATVSKLSNPSLTSPSHSSIRVRSLSPCVTFGGVLGFRSRVDVFPWLSVSGKRNVGVSLAVRCSLNGGNGSSAKRTVLHDLYENGGQSPWYDNLCRPVTDLLPLIDSGVRGVTGNPAVITLSRSV